MDACVCTAGGGLPTKGKQAPDTASEGNGPSLSPAVCVSSFHLGFARKLPTAQMPPLHGNRSPGKGCKFGGCDVFKQRRVGVHSQEPPHTAGGFGEPAVRKVEFGRDQIKRCDVFIFGRWGQERWLDSGNPDGN